MNTKTGRNDPCPCGSGKKYKHCCGKPAEPAEPARETAHEGAIRRALEWLTLHHRKAFTSAMQAMIDEVLFEFFDDDEAAEAAIADAGEAWWAQAQLNVTEWLLAEGELQVKGEAQRVSELLLGLRGPMLSVGQRDWLAQLARRPLRLYDVTEAVPGVGLTLCDALDFEQPPQRVIERAGSRALEAGQQIGARVMEVQGQLQLSGAVYAFSPAAGHALHGRLRALLAEFGAAQDAATLPLSRIVMKRWMAQFLLPAPLPNLIHTHTGEPLVFVTDHYDVRDWDALTTALSAQADVNGNHSDGWDRSLECDDGFFRPLATLSAASGGQRVAVLYKTARLAESGRAWFDALAGASVKFLLQEVSDPKGMLATADVAAARSELPTWPMDTDTDADTDTESLADTIEAVIRRIYAKWADEPIPALNHQTPRQSMRSEAALERVKGLLRSYEGGEVEPARQQRRREISYQFLWDAPGLTR